MRGQRYGIGTTPTYGGFLDMVKHDFVTFQRIRYGAVAQLAERVARIHEARGSNPLSSITLI